MREYSILAQPTTENPVGTSDSRSIPAACEQLRFQIDRLDKTMAELEQRLAPVLRPSPPVQRGKGETAPTERASLSASIRSAAQDVAEASNFIESVFARLEL